MVILINFGVVWTVNEAMSTIDSQRAKLYQASALFDEGVSRIGEEPREAEAYFREACELFEKEVGPESGNTEIRAHTTRLFESVVGRESDTTEIRTRAAVCHRNLGLIALQTSRPAIAVSEFERAVWILERLASNSRQKRSEVSMHLVTARGNLALTLASGASPTPRNLKRAVTLARQNTELSPDVAETWNLLAAIELKMGSIQPAIKDLEQSMELRKGGDSHEWFLLACAHALNGDRDKARQFYNRAVHWMEAHQPRQQDLLELRSRTAQLLGRSP
jgi:tetratricopeptide (TPR) repeat protein